MTAMQAGGVRQLAPVRANRLLAALPDGDRQRFVDACDSVELVSGSVLHAAGAKIDYVYFPTSGFIAVMMPVDADSIL